jgi:hypothetical protein
MDMALGLTHHGTPPKRFLEAGLPPNTVRLEREAIEVFGKNHNAATYRHWRNQGLTPTRDVRFDFEGAFNEAAANASNIHFNLDGFDLQQAWRLGQNADPYLCGPAVGGVRMPGFTNWEFVRVLGNPTLRQKTAFWQNGRQVPLSGVLERAGVSPNAIP